MRTTVVPAQVTTVEDRITGSLGVSQLILLVLPIFIGSGFFVILPPFFQYATYKIVLIVCLAVLTGTLAIRIKGKIVLMWLMVILKFNMRPKYYVFDRRNDYLRKEELPETTIKQEAEKQKPVQKSKPQLPIEQLVQVETLLTHPEANFHLKTNRKGAISVHFTEIQK